MKPAVGCPKKVEVETAVGTALAPVPFAMTVFAACAASWVRAREPEMVERVEVAAE
jgi:hypothetical protein